MAVLTPVSKLSHLVSSALGVSLFSVAAHSAPIIANGDFATGDLTGWSSYTTVNGTIGTPNVAVFDVLAGSFNNATQLRVGQINYGSPAAGGGITQAFNLTNSGNYSVHADIASKNTHPLYANADGGIFSLLIDGVSVSTYSFGSINSGISLRSSLNYTGLLSAGSHVLSIEALRPWLTSSTTPIQYIDNVSVAAVPEADASVLMLSGATVVGLLMARRRRTPAPN